MLRNALILLLIAPIFLQCKGQPRGTTFCAAGGEELNVAMDAWSAAYTSKGKPPQYEGRGNRTATIALKEGVCEMGASSEALPDEDIHSIVTATGKKPTILPIAIEGMAFIASADISATSISQIQLKKIFANGEQDGSAIGLAGKLQAYGINSASDRYNWIKKDVISASFSDRVRELSGPLALADKIQQTSGGIGYVRPREAGSARILAVKTDKGNVLPTVETIRNGSYPFTRQYYLYLVNPSRETREFVRFILSEEAQKQLLPIGLYPLSDAGRKAAIQELDKLQ
ncbi:MAG: substrate-binding domain-containing protein [Spirochaetia bacterium]|nr:substrate-binding domain-containing protein [Spirochaetia bacterium]